MRNLIELGGPIPPRETAAETVYRRLREAILSGRLPEGAVVRESAVAAAWGVSRTPVRDALRRLLAEGLVEGRRGRGVVVAALTPQTAAGLLDLWEAIGGMAARRAAERATPEVRAQLSTLIKTVSVAARGGDAAFFVAAEEAIHTAVGSAAGNPVLAQAVEQVRGRLRPLLARLLQNRGRTTRSFRELARLTAAIRSRDPDRAEAALREHVASLRQEGREAGWLPPGP